MTIAPSLSFRAQPRNPGRSHTNDPRTWETRVAPRGRRVLDGARSWILRLRCAPLRMTVVVGRPCTRALANAEPPPFVIPSAAEESRTIAHQRPKDLGDTRGASGAEGTRWRKVLDSSTPLRSAQNDSGGRPSAHLRMRSRPLPVIPSAAEESRTIAYQRPKDLGDTRGASGAEGTRWRKVLDSSTPLRSAQNDNRLSARSW